MVPALIGALLFPYILKAPKQAIVPIILPVILIFVVGRSFFSSNQSYIMVGAVSYTHLLGPEKPEIRRFLSRMTPYQFDGCLRLKELDGDPQAEEIRRLWEEDVYKRQI